MCHCEAMTELLRQGDVASEASNVGNNIFKQNSGLQMLAFVDPDSVNIKNYVDLYPQFEYNF